MDGHGVTGKNGTTVLLSVSGMTCDGCARTVERVLSRMPGVGSARVDFGRGVATVTGSTAPSALVEAIKSAGYGAKIATDDGSEGERRERGGSSCC